MMDIGFLIPNKYCVIVNFLSKQSSSIVLPLRLGPQEILTYVAIAIVFVYGNHNVNVDLQVAYPMPNYLIFMK